MENNLIDVSKFDELVQQAKEHAQKLNAVALVTDDDVKNAKKERAQARKNIRMVGEAIKNAKQAKLAEIEEEVTQMKGIENELNTVYEQFFDKVAEEEKAMEEEKRECFNKRVSDLIDSLSLTITLDDVDEEIYKATKNLKTDKKLSELLIAKQEEVNRYYADLKNIQAKAVSYDLSTAKYMTLFNEGMPATEVMQSIEDEAEQLKAQEKTLKQQQEAEQQQQQAEIEETKQQMNDRAEELRLREEAFEKEAQEFKERKEQEEKDALVEKRMAEVQGKTIINMKITYEKTPENSEALNKALNDMKQVAEVKLMEG